MVVKAWAVVEVVSAFVWIFLWEVVVKDCWWVWIFGCGYGFPVHSFGFFVQLLVVVMELGLGVGFMFFV